MEIATIKLELMSLLLKEQKESVLAKIKQVFEEESATDWWDDLSEEQKARIQQGKNEADQGLLLDHEDVMKAFDKWRTI